MQKSWDGGGNNAYKIFSSRVEEGYIPNTILYVELFMTTMKIKNNLCDEYQYEIQKSLDGGGKNAYKIFTSWVEEGTIPNTISYVELFMNTLKIKNNFCNGHQYEIQKSRDRGGNSAYKIFSSRVEEGYIPNTISYVKLFMTTKKIKNNFCDRYQYEIQKSWVGGRNNTYKIFTNLVEEVNIPNTISSVELIMNTLKIKNNFCIGHKYEMQKSRDGGGNNAYKIFSNRVEEGYIPNKISYVKLFMTTMKIKNNLCDGYQYEIQKSGDGGGNNIYKIFTNLVEEGNIPNTTSYMELFMNTMK